MSPVAMMLILGSPELSAKEDLDYELKYLNYSNLHNTLTN